MPTLASPPNPMFVFVVNSLFCGDFTTGFLKRLGDTNGISEILGPFLEIGVSNSSGLLKASVIMAYWFGTLAQPERSAL